MSFHAEDCAVALSLVGSTSHATPRFHSSLSYSLLIFPYPHHTPNPRHKHHGAYSAPTLSASHPLVSVHPLVLDHCLVLTVPHHALSAPSPLLPSFAYSRASLRCT